jgi:DNA polymerase-3 subunit delta'
VDVNDLAPWLHAPLRRSLDALASGRLPHALMVCGPAHIGKRAFADALVRALLCRERVDGAACGHCRDCALHSAGTHPDWKYLSFEENEKTKVLRKEIVIEQIRDLGTWFALTPQRGGAQVALIEPADAMNANASNALLKTLEEPMHDRYLLLLCESPMRLSATIRSRCQRIELQPPSRQIGLAWLRARGHDEAIVRTAHDAARGHPGLAAHWIEQGLLELRESVRADLAAIVAGKARPLAVASAWLADEQAEQRLAFAADIAVDLHAQALGSRDAVAAAGSGRSQAARLTVARDLPKLSAWFDAANRVRALLRTPIRSDLALAGLLRDWRIAMSPYSG